MPSRCTGDHDVTQQGGHGSCYLGARDKRDHDAMLAGAHGRALDVLWSSHQAARSWHGLIVLHRGVMSSTHILGKQIKMSSIYDRSWYVTHQKKTHTQTSFGRPNAEHAACNFISSRCTPVEERNEKAFLVYIQHYLFSGKWMPAQYKRDCLIALQNWYIEPLKLLCQFFGSSY